MAKISKAQVDYIEQNAGKLSISQLAEDTGLSPTSIKSKLKAVRENPKQPEHPTTTVEVNGEKVTQEITPVIQELINNAVKDAISKVMVPKPEEENTQKPITTIKKGETMTRKAFGRNNAKTAVVMTEGAAQLGDEFRNANKGKKKPMKHIHKPFG